MSYIKLILGLVSLLNTLITWARERQLISEAEHAQIAVLMAEQDKVIAEANRIRNLPIPDGVSDEFDRHTHPRSN